MTLKAIAEAWNDFFFAKQSPLPIALFRIFYGSLVIATLTLLRPDWLAWYGTHAWLSLATASKLDPGTRLNLFSVMPQSDAWIEALFWVSIGSAVLLTAGLLTRLNSIIVFICLASIQQRNLYILHGGDTFLRLSGFFLIFAPAGAAVSIDRLIHVRRGKENSDIVEPSSPWAQRMIQLQLSLMYITTFLLKLKGPPWLLGSALFYIYHLDEFKRFPIPQWFFQPTALKFGCWATLVLECSLGVLIWIREFRYPLLAIGLLFHLWLEYSLNIPLFQWDILSAYILFVDPDDLKHVGSWITR